MGIVVSCLEGDRTSLVFVSHQDPSGSIVGDVFVLILLLKVFWYVIFLLLLNFMYCSFTFYLFMCLVVWRTSWTPCLHPSPASGASSSGSRQPDLYDGDDSVDGFLAVVGGEWVYFGCKNKDYTVKSVNSTQGVQPAILRGFSVLNCPDFRWF